MLIGTACLGTILKAHSSKAAPVAHNMEIKLDSQHSVVYPIDPDKNTTVEIDGGKVKITAVKQ